jgi:hypothetical protein
MAQRAESAAGVTRLAVAFVHATTVGPRNCGFAPEHPAVAIEVERAMSAAADTCVDGMMQLAVAPHALPLACRSTRASSRSSNAPSCCTTATSIVETVGGLEARIDLLTSIMAQ